jgi:hypothetical protein
MSTGPVNVARGRRMVLLLALLFFGPLLLAAGLYYGSAWRPAQLTSHGTLIVPPRPLAAPLFHGKWSLVYVGPASCDQHCQRTLYYMRQTHLGLGRLYARAQRVFLATAPCCMHAELAQQYPGLITVDAASSASAPWLAAFPVATRATGIFIVDPHGNLMMRYDSTDRPEGLLSDLKQLLGLSSIG